MYELIVLGFLMRLPMHGYLMAKIFNNIFGPFAKVSSGRLYPLLTKLEGQGLIAINDNAMHSKESDQRQRTFQVTATGRQRFHQLMMDTTSNPGEYQKLFWQKVPFLDFLQPSERLYLIDHYVNYCQTHIFHLTNEMEELAREATELHFMNSVQLDATLRAMRHQMSQWQVAIEHAKSLRESTVMEAPIAQINSTQKGVLDE